MFCRVDVDVKEGNEHQLMLSDQRERERERE